MDFQIKNANFLTNKMSKADVINAFDMTKETQADFINNLIKDGLLIKTTISLYKPSEKLLNQLYLPVFVNISPMIRKFLSKSNSFSLKQLILVFNKQEIKRMLKLGYFYLDCHGRYRRTQLLDDLVAEGEDKIILQPEKYMEKIETNT